MSDLEKLQLTINEKSDETLETTRRMREMCAEAKVGLNQIFRTLDCSCFYIFFRESGFLVFASIVFLIFFHIEDDY